MLVRTTDKGKMLIYVKVYKYTSMLYISFFFQRLTTFEHRGKKPPYFLTPLHNMCCLTIFHPEWLKLSSFSHSECSRVKRICSRWEQHPRRWEVHVSMTESCTGAFITNNKDIIIYKTSAVGFQGHMLKYKNSVHIKALGVQVISLDKKVT